MSTTFFHRRCVFAAWLFILSVFGGCGKSTVSVDVHGVNYSNNEFSYLLVDPESPDSSSAGEHIDRYAAGGTTCCYPLPKQWHPGIKVRIRTTHWLMEKDSDGHLPEIHEEHVVEVPQYVNGKPGELWVVRAADGKVSVVSSDFQPDHPNWPATPKGWPVPSLEYRRERWKIYRDHEEGGVRLYQSLLEELAKDPERRAKEAWESASKYNRDSIKGFAGPGDPRYVTALHDHYEKALIESRARLQRVMEERP